MTKFTQGKWIFDDEYIFTANKGWMIADVMAVRNKDECNANGRLIAAAPEMYELLESLVNILLAHSYNQDKAIRIANLLARIDGEEENDD